jgi:MFS family permease
MLVAGPTSGYLSDRFGARWFATGGMLGSALSFFLLTLLPIDFSFWLFALVLAMVGVSMGMFASPNRAAVMNSLPPQHRGAGGGMNQTFQNSAQVLSIGVFFTLMILGPRLEPAAHAVLGAPGTRGLGGRGEQRGAHAAGVGAVRGVSRLQPDRTPRRDARARLAYGRQPSDPRWALVLPAPDLWAISHGPARGIPVRDPRVPDRGGCIAACCS